ncbi:L,D-transpeptidase [Aureimonas mangrovi]|uniref:L,D-transpeptidase n=1 Tax=Aureimonas mangrovi TaxID=2758041 RepID=UPI00163DA2F0|nr:L,D-transpeptidase [Aureimonas mangrovi]
MTISRTMAAAVFAGLTAFAIAGPASAQQTRYYDFSAQRWVQGTPTERAQVTQTQRAQARSTQTMPRPDARFARHQVQISTNEKPGTIIVDTGRKFLYYVEGNGQATRYGVGVGKEGFAWAGAATVGRKAEWPGWTPPAAMRKREAAKGRILPAYMAGGPDNPLGARALYLYRGGRDTLYRIHGTNQPWTIGQNMSSGCIRMMNEDVEHLYERVNNGAKVVVIGPNANSDNVYAETGVMRQAGGEGQRGGLFSQLFGSRVQ